MDLSAIHNEQTKTNEEVIHELMTQYGNDVLKLIMQYVHQQQIAEDLTQEVFIKCYQSLASFNNQSSLKTWLWRIAINHTKDYLKSWHARNMLTMDQQLFHEEVSSEQVGEALIEKQQQQQLTNALLQLPIKYREVIYLCYYEERSMKDIAKVLQINENTVKTRLRKAKQLLKKQWERE